MERDFRTTGKQIPSKAGLLDGPGGKLTGTTTTGKRVQEMSPDQPCCFTLEDAASDLFAFLYFGFSFSILYD
jgi:hypothetical protein